MSGTGVEIGVLFVGPTLVECLCAFDGGRERLIIEELGLVEWDWFVQIDLADGLRLGRGLQPWLWVTEQCILCCLLRESSRQLVLLQLGGLAVVRWVHDRDVWSCTGSVELWRQLLWPRVLCDLNRVFLFRMGGVQHLLRHSSWLLWWQEGLVVWWKTRASKAWSTEVEGTVGISLGGHEIGELRLLQRSTCEVGRETLSEEAPLIVCC